MRFSIRWILFAMVWVGLALVYWQWQWSDYDWPTWWLAFKGDPWPGGPGTKPDAYYGGMAFRGLGCVVAALALAVSAVGGLGASITRHRTSKSKEPQ